VDKPGLLHRLKGLRALKAAEQGLRLARTLTGQKTACVQVGWFRTFDPVDIHGLVHRRPGWQGRGRGLGQAGRLAGVGIFFAQPGKRSGFAAEAACALEDVARSKPKKFSGELRSSETGRQVYKQKLVYE
jgi:hypothetical protein